MTPLKILVAYASRMGSTAEIAERIGRQLSEAGHEVQVTPCAEAPDAGGYDAVILGSALYLGRWDASARGYLRSQETALAGRPTWLFQSGPCGDGFDLEQAAAPRSVRRRSERMGLEPPVTFGGRLDRTRTKTPLSRWMATGTYAGDFRDWDQVHAWTATVLDQLAEGRHRASLPAP